MSENKSLIDTYELNVYPKRDVVFVKGKGCRLYDENGNEFLDLASNVGVASLGYGNIEIADAVYQQYKNLGSCYSIFYNDVRAKLVEKLVQITPQGLDKVFLCNSGTESVEAAIKFARAASGKSEIIAAVNGYHGKTMGSLSATWTKDYKDMFAPMLDGFSHVPYNKFEKIEQAVTDKTAAIILEVVQGEGGVKIGDKDYFKQVRKLCDDKNILLIIDEVQTGFCRTGTMFACGQYVTPDILCLSKAIAGGFPMGAVVCRGDIEIPSKSHSSTFGGNPVACAAALKSIEIMERDNLANKSRVNGEYFLSLLRGINSDKIRELRGLGLMIGIELKERAGKYVQQLMDEGIIALLAGNLVIRLLPPLTISKSEIDFAAGKINKVLTE